MTRLPPLVAHAALMLGGFVMVLPFLWMLIASLTSQGDIFSGRLVPVPSLAAAAENYALALTAVPLLRFMLNGAVVCGLILALQLVVALPCGYALAKLDFPGRPLLFSAVLFGLLIPIQVPTIPLYVAIARLGLIDSYAALVLPWVISVFAIFLFRQFFVSFPDEILDAARLDGFSEISIVWRIMVPAAWPAIAAFSIFSVVAHWNDLYWPLVVVTSPEMMTPPLGIAHFRQGGEGTGHVGALMAGGVLVTAPLVAVFLFAQRHFIRGLTMARR